MKSVYTFSDFLFVFCGSDVLQYISWSEGESNALFLRIVV